MISKNPHKLCTLVQNPTSSQIGKSKIKIPHSKINFGCKEFPTRCFFFIKFGAKINSNAHLLWASSKFCRLLSFPFQHIFIKFGQIVVLVLYVQMITMTVMPRKNFTTGCFNHYCHLCHLSKMQLNHCAIVVLW